MKLTSKRKYSFEDFSQKKKIRFSKRKEEINLDNVINLRMPHIGEQIFESINTDDLFCVMKVSEIWKILAENVLLKRWKGEILQACKIGKTKVVKLLLEHYKSEKSELNMIDHHDEYQQQQATTYIMDPAQLVHDHYRSC